MSFLFRKTCDFVFYRRAVSCASPLNDAREQWGTVETFANDFMRTLVGPGYVAGKLRKCVSLAMKAEAGGRFVAKLGFQCGIINTGTQDAGRSSGFQSSELQPVTAQGV